jgi:hypothetical protein
MRIQSTMSLHLSKSMSFLAVLVILGICMRAEAFVARNQQNQGRPLRVSTDASETKQPSWTMENLEDYAERTGVIVSFTTMGPGYRAVARAKHDESLILGYVEGFVRPAGQILHLDKMEIFKPAVQKAKQQVPNAFDFGGISFGVGLVLGYRCLLHGESSLSRRCRMCDV